MDEGETQRQNQFKIKAIFEDLKIPLRKIGATYLEFLGTPIYVVAKTPNEIFVALSRESKVSKYSW
jgi:hypothetical protein